MAIPPLSWAKTAATWLWNKIRGRPTVQADRAAVAAGRDQAIRDSVITAEQALRGEMVAAVQYFYGPVTILSVPERVDDLPDVALEGPPQAFKEGQLLEAAGDHAGAIAQYERAFAAARGDYNRALLHINIAHNLRELDRRAEAEGHLLQALSLARGAAEPKVEGSALWGLGVASYTDDNWERAEAYSREAIETFRSLGDEWAAARVTILLGLVHRRQNRLDEAEQCITQALGTYRHLGDEKHQALCLYDLTTVYRDRGDPDSLSKGEGTAKEALAIYEKLGDRHGKVMTLYALGLIYDSRTDPDRAQKAEECYLAASQLDSAEGNVASQARALNRAGRMSLARGHHLAAIGHCSSALTLFRQVRDEAGAAEALGNLGVAHLVCFQPDDAEKHLVQALTKYRELQDLGNEALITIFRGFALALRKDLAGAEEKFRRAQELLSQAGHDALAGEASQLMQSLRELQRLVVSGSTESDSEASNNKTAP